jgi:hypothetical protein
LAITKATPKLALALTAALMASGCASITRGSTETWTADSDPTNAELRTSHGHSCTTPCTLELKRNQNFTVHIKREGYEPVEADVGHSTAGAGGVAMAGNILFGGLIGVAVDAATGATQDLEPNPLRVKLVPLAPIAPDGPPVASAPGGALRAVAPRVALGPLVDALRAMPSVKVVQHPAARPASRAPIRVEPMTTDIAVATPSPKTSTWTVAPETEAQLAPRDRSLSIEAEIAKSPPVRLRQPGVTPVSDDAIRQRLVQQSIGQYSGSCPCPYNVDRGGRSCGRRSAYSRPGGESPYCYPSDVPASAIEAHRQRSVSALQ